MIDMYEQYAKFFKALMHPARLAILDMLRTGEECVCHMESVLGLRQAYISQQLMALRKAGLVLDRRDGWNIYYRVSKPEIFGVMDSVKHLVKEDISSLKSYEIDNLRMKRCDCPKCKAVM